MDRHQPASPDHRPWFQRGFRRMLVDMHIPDWDPGFLAKYDPHAMADMYQRSGLTSAMIYCQSHVGLCYWPTASGAMHAGLQGRDVTAELVAAMRSRGLAVCAYYSVIYNNWAWLQRPEWRIVPPGKAVPTDGSFAGGRYGHCCPNNPGYRGFVRTQITELVGGYDFDGLFYDMTFWPSICTCGHCRARFRAEDGLEIPEVIDWCSPAWCAFAAARERWMADFSAMLSAHAKSVRAGLPVYHNFAAALHNWTLGLPFAAAESHDFMGADFYGDAIEQLMVSKFMAGLGRRQPIEFMTSCCVNLRDHVRLKGADEMRRQAFAATLFSGAFLFIDAINPDGTVQPAIAGRVGGIYAETAPYEPFLGGDAVADIAIYLSDDSRMDFSENGAAATAAPYWSSQFPHAHGVRGLCRILQAAHLPFTIITRKDLADLGRFRVVALPSVLRMTGAEADAFRAYVRGGGRLYASGQTSLTRSDGRRLDDFLLADVFGCHAAASDGLGTMLYLKPSIAAVAAALEPQLLLSQVQPPAAQDRRCDSGARAVRLSGQATGEVLATLSLPYASPQPGTVVDRAWASIHSSPPWEDTPDPALVRHAYGEGVAIYASAPIESIDAEANHRLVEHLFRDLLGMRPAYAAEAHPVVWMNVQHVAERNRFTVAFLNSQAQGPPLPVPHLRFTLRVPEGCRFTGLHLAPSMAPVPFAIDDHGDLKAEVRDLELFAMLVADYVRAG